MIQADIAEMAVAIEASRALVYKAAMLHGQQPAAQPFRCHRQVPRIADGQDVCRQGRADLRRLWLGRGISGCPGYRAYADMFFTGEGSANVQKIMIAEDALGYKIADRHHGKTGLRDIRKDDPAKQR
jgi:alkylation response protein AidB-like acyl-CoA dehydrogenase